MLTTFVKNLIIAVRWGPIYKRCSVLFILCLIYSVLFILNFEQFQQIN